MTSPLQPHIHILSFQRVLRALGRGAAPRRRTANNPAAYRVGGRGRGRISLDAVTTSPVGGNRAQAEPAQQAAASVESIDSPVSMEIRSIEGQQQERRSSGRQRNSGDDGGPSGSGVGASINIEGRIRFGPIASDSSEDDGVADPILFHTFLPSGRGSDRSKRQN